MKIENTTIKAGAVTNLLGKFGSKLDRLFDKIDSWGDDNKYSTFGVLTISEDTDTKKLPKNAKDYPVRAVMKRTAHDPEYDVWDFAMKFKDDDNSKAVNKKGVKIIGKGYLEDIGEEETSEQYKKRWDNFLMTNFQELAKKLYKGKEVNIDDWEEITASMKVTLDKVTANSEPEITLTKITSDYDFDITLKALTDVISDDSFVESMPEGCASYEICCDPECYDVTPMTEEDFQINICDSIHAILQAAYCLWATCKVLSWNGTGPYSAYLSQSCDMYAYEVDEMINYLSKLNWMKCKVAPHPADFFCNDTLCLQTVLDISEPLQALKIAMDGVINAINLLACNFDKDEQQTLYQYLGRWKQNKDYTLAKMER